MPSIGPLELVVVLIIALMVFGPKRLPEMGRSVGHGIREFKDSLTSEKDDEEEHKGITAAPAQDESPALHGEVVPDGRS